MNAKDDNAMHNHVIPPSVIGLIPFENTSLNLILNPTPASADAN